MDDHKGRVLCDVDGVITVSGYHGPDDFAPLRPGAGRFLKQLGKTFDEVVVFSARDPEVVKKYLRENGLMKYVNDVTRTKLPARVYLDDRAVTFKGDFAQALEEIEDFRAYWEDGTDKAKPDHPEGANDEEKDLRVADSPPDRPRGR